MKNSITQREQYYGDYLQLDKLLDAQFPESDARGIDAHDELLFIIIHQAYELWFKQIAHEVNSIERIFRERRINDNSAALQTVVHRLGRVVEIWKLLVEQVRVLETMTPMDFLDFRDLLTPASGFQSFQFRTLETKLGLRMQDRFQQKYYQQQLREEHLQGIEAAEQEASIFELVDRWLARIPFWDVEKYWHNYATPEGARADLHPFWATYRHVYEQGLSNREAAAIPMQGFDALFFDKSPDRQTRLSAEACQAVLFINLYRDYPLLQQPFQLLGKLLEIDELMATWRYRHMIMVRRMIGMRSGTGGSSGAGYLHGAVENHHIFKDFAAMATYLIPRTKLPVLPAELERRLRYYDL